MIRRLPPPGTGVRALVAAAMLAVATVAVSTPVKTAHVEAELVSSKTAIVPGEPVVVALRLAMERGWHTYWRNPGDSGLPTTLAWTLPQGIEAGPIEWPAPRLLPAGPLVNYGFDGELLLPVELVPQRSLAPPGPLILKARADWLVCKEICIPEGADLELALSVAASAAADPRWGAPIAGVRAALPRPLEGWQVIAEGRGQTIALKLTPPAGTADPGELRFFSYAEAKIEPSRPQIAERIGAGHVLTLPVAFNFSGELHRIEGVLTASSGFPGGVRAATIDAALTGTVVAGPNPALAPAPALSLKPPPDPGLSLFVALAFALVGGVALNLMPCVFPVLSIKVLGFATHRDTRPTLHHEAFAFAAGVVLAFVSLGLLLAVLRAAGEELGWGFQLQSPVVVTLLAALFFVLALNLSGVFEFGQIVPSALASYTAKNRTLDAFGSGVLAVLVASPCTAPFMGAALGYALSASKATTFIVFATLGLGMALPYVTLALFPAWRRHVPRPGPWLVYFKQLLAFPLYATVIWLAWVLGAQRDNDAVVRLLLALLCIGFALWAWRIVRTGGARPWGIAGAAALVCAVAVAWPLFRAGTEGTAAGADGRTARSDADWTPYTPARLAELASGGRTVFVDFTAAWCVTCQVNKRLVLNAADVRSAFARHRVALLRADWTRRDPDITRALAALGRNGVPVYVLYRPGKEPVLLPEILLQQTVLDALASL
jgi:thiol:disulfide interchange protein/DsbC/DsbD-like thiol-disulfide interchange protein